VSGSRRILAAALVLGAALRLAAVVAYRGAPLSAGGDDRQYHGLAESLAAGRGFELRGAPSAYRAPLYPLFLAAGMRLGLRELPQLRLWQAAFSLFGIVLVFLLGAAIDSPDAGAWSALVLALHPEQVLAVTSLYLESFYAVLVILLAWALVRWRRAPGEGRAAFAGMALGLTLAARSVLLPLLPALILERARRPGWRREAAAFALAAVLPVLPWAARNALRFGRLIPFETGVAGPVIWYAAQGYTVAPADEGAVEPMKTMFATMPHTEWDAYALGLASAEIAREPRSYVEGCVFRLRRLWTDAYLPYLIHENPKWEGVARPSPWAKAARADLFLRFALGALAAVSLLLAPSAGLAATALVGASFSVYALGTVFARFLAPVTPLLCVLAGPALARFTRPEPEL